jgi:hypothetical protein
VVVSEREEALVQRYRLLFPEAAFEPGGVQEFVARLPPTGQEADPPV